jgi:hypothetical protein
MEKWAWSQAEKFIQALNAIIKEGAAPLSVCPHLHKDSRHQFRIKHLFPYAWHFWCHMSSESILTLDPTPNQPTSE